MFHVCLRIAMATDIHVCTKPIMMFVYNNFKLENLCIRH